MVNTGKPSGGCTACRHRKIKCDETRPGCERCTKYGIICPGYGRPFQFHVYENQLPRTRRRKRTKNRAAGASEGPVKGSITSLRPCCEDECIQFFLKQHILPSRPGCHPGHMEFLGDLRVELDQDTCLKPALQSVSYLAMYYHTKSRELQLRAHEAHGNALRTVSRDLGSLTPSKVVHSLAAIMLLGVFDDLSGTSVSPWGTHVLAAEQVLERQRMLFTEAQIPHQLRVWILVQLHIYSSATNQVFPFQYSHHQLNVADDYRITSDGHLLISRMHRLQMLSRTWRSAARQQSSGADTEIWRVDSVQDFGPVILQAMALQENIDAWGSSMSSAFGNRQVTTSAGASKLTCLSRWIGCFRSLFYGSLIVFYTELIDSCGLFVEMDVIRRQGMELELAAETIRRSESNLKEALDVFSSLLDFLMGDIDQDGLQSRALEQNAACGHLLAWPLAVAKASPYSTPDQKKAFESALDRTSSTVGIGLAKTVEGLVAKSPSLL